MKEVWSTEEASPTNERGMNPGADAFSSSTHSIQECQVPLIFHPYSFFGILLILLSNSSLCELARLLLKAAITCLTYQSKEGRVSPFELRIVDPCIL